MPKSKRSSRSDFKFTFAQRVMDYDARLRAFAAIRRWHREFRHVLTQDAILARIGGTISDTGMKL